MSIAWDAILVASSINIMLALGVYVTMLNGQISVAHAALAGVGGYTAGILTVRYDAPFIVALLAGTLAASVAGMVIGAFTSKMGELVAALVTIGVAEALVVVANNLEALGGSLGFTGMALHTSVMTVAAALIAVCYVVWRFDVSRLGLAARCIRDGPDVAASVGIPVRELKVATYGLGGACAGLAGGVSAHYFLVVAPNDMGFTHGLELVIFVLVGGSYSLWGAIAGASLLTILPELLRFSPDSRLILYGILVVLIVIWRPNGVVTRSMTAALSNLLRGKRATADAGRYTT